MKARVFLMAALLMASASAFAGHEVGNGGDGISQEFVALGRSIVEKLRENPNPKIPDLDALTHAIDNTVVVTKEVLTLNDAEVDAINYPDWNRIEVSRKRWREYDLKRKTTLVLHEYLGIARADDSHYQISSSFTDIALPQERQRQIELGVKTGIRSYRNFGGGGIGLGGQIGYRFSPQWAIFGGYTHYKQSYHWGSSSLNLIELSGRYSFAGRGRFRPFVTAGVGLATESFIFDEGFLSSYFKTIDVAPDKTSVSISVGVNYYLNDTFGIDTSIFGTQLFGQYQRFLSSYSAFYGIQLGVNCAF